MTAIPLAHSSCKTTRESCLCCISYSFNILQELPSTMAIDVKEGRATRGLNDNSRDSLFVQPNESRRSCRRRAPVNLKLQQHDRPEDETTEGSHRSNTRSVQTELLKGMERRPSCPCPSMRKRTKPWKVQ